jgi:S1-C subfamily serine protease
MQVDSVTKRLLFNTVRVDTQLDDGGTGSGTAFVVEHAHRNTRHRFIVTNRHLVEGVSRGGLIFTQRRHGQPLLGEHFHIGIDDFPQAWFMHPDPAVDLAVVPLRPLERAAQAQGVELYVQPVDSADIGDAAALAGFDALEEVLFIGYPNGVWDQVNLTPILRRGTTATPMALDFEGRAEFLIDAAVYPGSSGSPVFALPGPRQRGGAPGERRPLLVGVVAAVYFREEPHRLVAAPVPAHQGGTVIGSEMIDLGLVIKAQAVLQAVQAYLGRWRE